MSSDPTRYQYQAPYIPDLQLFREQVLEKDIIPHQVEWQPGPPGQNICWLECPYCYGKSAEMTSDRLSTARSVEVLNEIADGGVRKMIFAGYATDPLYSRDIVPLVTTAVSHGMTVGFNTKALHVGEKLLSVLSLESKGPNSYASVSIDAGSNETYNAVHGVKTSSVNLYSKVIENLGLLADTGIEVAATYLVNRLNADRRNLSDFLTDAISAGCAIIRFAFAQLPRGATEMPTVPTREECQQFSEILRPLVEKWDSPECRVLLVDADAEYDIFRKPRTLPCVARWVFPTVGYDGWLYHCSQSAAPNFRDMALGNLAENDFWDLYYTYVMNEQYFPEQKQVMDRLGCACDRKEHLLNIQVGGVLR